jgi:hypothetical protein
MIYKVSLCALALALPTALAASDEPALAPPICDYGTPHPEAPEELAQFDFLIGDYTISAHQWLGTAWSPPRPGAPARWNGYYTLGGMAIADEWFDPDPGHDPNSGRGINIRMWDAEAGEWDMTWVHTLGRQVQDLRAGMKDGVLTMWQIYPERPDFKATFERLDADNWERIQYKQDEAGEWQPTFKLVATRIPCTESDEAP